MDVNEAKLICPYCGAGYQARDTTCPNCGRALSPTGYTPYGGGEAMELPNATPVVGSITPTGTEGNVGQHATDINQRIDKTLGIILWGVIAVVVLFFVFSHLGSSITPRAYPTNTPPPPLIAIAATRTPTPVYQSDPNAGKVRIGYVRVLGTSAGTLVANIYDLGTGADPFPPPGVFGAGSVGTSGGAVALDAYTGTNTIVTATKFTRYELPYRRGSVLLSVVNDVAYGDRLIILTSTDITTTQHYPNANFIIAGQLIAGFDVLERLNSSDQIGVDQINPLADRKVNRLG